MTLSPLSPDRSTLQPPRADSGPTNERRPEPVRWETVRHDDLTAPQLSPRSIAGELAQPDPARATFVNATGGITTDGDLPSETDAHSKPARTTGRHVMSNFRPLTLHELVAELDRLERSARGPDTTEREA